MSVHPEWPPENEGESGRTAAARLTWPVRRPIRPNSSRGTQIESPPGATLRGMSRLTGEFNDWADAILKPPRPVGLGYPSSV